MTWHYGDVVMVGLDPTLGHEQKKRRPGVVVSSDEFNRHCTTTIVVPVSHGRGDFELHVPLTPTRLDDGSVLDGHAQVEHVRAMDLTACDAQLLGRLGEGDLEHITDMLLGCLVGPDTLIVPSGY
ncbi:MAG: type II toxin-antitoxin system PemK/MazF family toxin [Bifidobacterium sp.]|nr:type II toxin-antitoxin system PemK/MazF family toxin [Bifidobacterium sp.]